MDERLEALKTMRAQLLPLVETALQGVDRITSMLAVWGVHTGRVEDALFMIEQRGLVLTENALWELASVWSLLWGVDVSRDARPHCFLCARKLPEGMEALCKCYRAVEAGVHIQPTPDRMAYIKRMYPIDWESVIVETIVCVRCGTPEGVPASRVDTHLRKGKVWRVQTQKYCNNCFQSAHPQVPTPMPAVKKARNRPSVAYNKELPGAQHPDIDNFSRLVEKTALPAGDS